MRSCGQQLGKEDSGNGSMLVSVGGQLAIPADLALHILAALPLIPHLFRLRLVCRSWNALLRSHYFLQLWSQCNRSSCCWIMASPPIPCLPPSSLTAHDDGGDPDDNVWRTLEAHINTLLAVYFMMSPSTSRSGHWFPLRRHGFRLHSMDGLGQDQLGISISSGPDNVVWPVPTTRILAGGGGSLIAEIAFYEGLGPLIRVFNFLSACHRQLPIPSPSNCTPSPNNSTFFEWFGPWGSYRLIRPCRLCLLSSDDYYHLVLCTLGGGDKMYVYDSRRPNSWTAVFGLSVNQYYAHEPELPPPLALFEGHDIFKGDLFFPFFPQHMLFAYCVESDEWSQAIAPFPTAATLQGYPTVLKCGGSRILLAKALFTDDKLEGLLRPRCLLDGFALWELQCTESGNDGGHPSYSWVEVARTPKAFAEAHYDIWAYNFRPKFVHTSTLICMTTILNGREGCGRVGRCMAPLVYNLVLGLWYNIPAYKDTEELMIRCSFQPTFPGLLP